MTHKLVAIGAMLVALTACSNPSPKQAEASKTTDSAAQDKNIVRRPLGMVNDFTHLLSIGSVNIVYTQGDYSVEVEGDSAMLQYLNASFDSNLLTVSMQNDNNTDINLFGSVSNVTMYLSCPDLKCASVCGNGGFESKGKWSGDSIEVGVFGTGTLRLDTVECNRFKMEVNSVTQIDIANLTAKESIVWTRASATLNMDVDVEELSLINDYKPKVTLTGKAVNLMIKNPNDETLLNKMQ